METSRKYFVSNGINDNVTLNLKKSFQILLTLLAFDFVASQESFYPGQGGFSPSSYPQAPSSYSGASAQQQSPCQQANRCPQSTSAYPGPSSSGQQQPSPCQLTNKCCGARNRNCCVGGQKCYTVQERKCVDHDIPSCRIKHEKKCYDVDVKDCRTEQVNEERTFTEGVCHPKQKKECFQYTAQVRSLMSNYS